VFISRNSISRVANSFSRVVFSFCNASSWSLLTNYCSPSSEYNLNISSFCCSLISSSSLSSSNCDCFLFFLVSSLNCLSSNSIALISVFTVSICSSYCLLTSVNEAYFDVNWSNSTLEASNSASTRLFSSMLILFSFISSMTLSRSVISFWSAV